MTVHTQARRIVLGFAILVSACQPPDQSATASEAVRAADEAWSKAFRAKDPAATASFMDSAGVFMAPNAPAVTGPEAFRATMEGFFQLPGLSGGWQVASVQASKAGDMAYSSGTYEMTVTGPAGTPVTDRGKYATVWRRHTDGSWKVVVDVFNTDLPLQGMP